MVEQFNQARAACSSSTSLSSPRTKSEQKIFNESFYITISLYIYYVQILGHINSVFELEAFSRVLSTTATSSATNTVVAPTPSRGEQAETDVISPPFANLLDCADSTAVQSTPITFASDNNSRSTSSTRSLVLKGQMLFVKESKAVLFISTPKYALRTNSSFHPKE